MSTGIGFTLKNNQLGTNLLYWNAETDAEILEVFHSIKADYVQAVQFILRTVTMLFKDKQMI